MAIVPNDHFSGVTQQTMSSIIRLRTVQNPSELDASLSTSMMYPFKTTHRIQQQLRTPPDMFMMFPVGKQPFNSMSSLQTDESNDISRQLSHHKVVHLFQSIAITESVFRLVLPEDEAHPSAMFGSCADLRDFIGKLIHSAEFHLKNTPVDPALTSLIFSQGKTCTHQRKNASLRLYFRLQRLSSSSIIYEDDKFSNDTCCNHLSKA